MKIISLFGGSGQTGFEFLKQALANNYKVKALIRSPEKFSFTHQNLEIHKGDVLNLENVSNNIKDSDIVVSLFGHVKDSPEWLQTNGTRNIVDGMKTVGIKKIISLSGGGLPFPEKDKPQFIDKLIRTIMKIVVPKILNDAIEHHRVLENTDLNWIIVRGPRLINSPKINNYKIGWVGVNSGTSIGRSDLADFILKQVEKDEFIRQMPFVSS